ncbi:hypothetical protein SEA_SOOS_28 [Gordonia phage Soos]|nr:hypothetical protein SEA_SOOS_28 [Gordonia phage Soos]
MSSNYETQRAILAELDRAVTEIREAQKQMAKVAERLEESLNRGVLPFGLGYNLDVRTLSDRIQSLAQIATVSGIDTNDIAKLVSGEADLFDLYDAYKNEEN